MIVAAVFIDVGGCSSGPARLALVARARLQETRDHAYCIPSTNACLARLSVLHIRCGFLKGRWWRLLFKMLFIWYDLGLWSLLEFITKNKVFVYSAHLQPECSLMPYGYAHIELLVTLLLVEEALISLTREIVENSCDMLSAMLLNESVIAV